MKKSNFYYKELKSFRIQKWLCILIGILISSIIPFFLPLSLVSLPILFGLGLMFFGGDYFNDKEKNMRDKIENG
jgi:hypothetical protein